MIKTILMIVAAMLTCFSHPVALAETETYEASIEVDVSDAREVLSSLNDNLGLKLNVKVYADYAESLRIGHVYSMDFDMHFDGIVFRATYQISKTDSERVELTFASFQKPATSAICKEFAKFSNAGNAEHSPESCDYVRPDEFKV